MTVPEMPRFTDICIERNIHLFGGEIADSDEGRNEWKRRSEYRENRERELSSISVTPISKASRNKELNVIKTGVGESVMRRTGVVR
jgi:hypothetical protein